MRCGSIWVNYLFSGNLRKTYKKNVCGKGNQWLIKETNGLFKPLMVNKPLLIRPATVFLWGVVWHWGGGSLKFPLTKGEREFNHCKGEWGEGVPQNNIWTHKKKISAELPGRTLWRPKLSLKTNAFCQVVVRRMPLGVVAVIAWLGLGNWAAWVSLGLFHP